MSIRAPILGSSRRRFKHPTLAGSGLDVVVITSAFQLACDIVQQATDAGRRCLHRVLTPAVGDTGPLRGLLIDLTRSKQDLLAENALLRQQLVVAARKVKKPQFRHWEGVLLVSLSAMFARWRQALISWRAAQARCFRRYEHNPGYIARFRSTPREQSWSTVLRNQAAAIGARHLLARAQFVIESPPFSTIVSTWRPCDAAVGCATGYVPQFEE